MSANKRAVKHTGGKLQKERRNKAGPRAELPPNRWFAAPVPGALHARLEPLGLIERLVEAKRWATDPAAADLPYAVAVALHPPAKALHAPLLAGLEAAGAAGDRAVHEAMFGECLVPGVFCVPK